MALRTLSGPALAVFALLASTSASASQILGDETYYFGDLHSHTGYSGDAGSTDVGHCITLTGCGAFADMFDEARTAGLDFMTVSDHVNGFRTMTAAEWLVVHAAVLAANDEAGGFITIPGGEIWAYDGTGTSDPIGHKTLLLWEDSATLAGLTIDEARPNSTGHLTDCESLWDWADTLTASYGTISLIPHHPATASPSWTDWTCWSDDYSPAVEVYSRHGNSLEGDSGWDVPGAGVVSSGYAANGLDPDNYGLEFGFVGGTDAHDTHPGAVCDLDAMQATHLYGGGLTGVVLDASESFNRMAIHDAIEDRRTYATSGPMVPLALDWTVGGAEVGGLGVALSYTNDDEVGLTVTLTENDAAFVDEVLLIGPLSDWTMTSDGLSGWTTTLDANEVPEWLYVRVEIDGAAYWGTGACDDGGSEETEYIWSSPSFTTFVDEDLDDDGIDSDDGDCDDADATIYPGASETWYDGVDQDCDGADDYDQDGDGAEAATTGGTDCDDTDATIYPGAMEIWYDAVDQDCDGASDDDQDGDGLDVDFRGGTDCDDTDASVYTGAIDTWYDGVDQDCDGWSDDDQDHDTFDLGADCDDTSASVYPGAVELVADGVDQDCDGVDSCYADDDGDDGGSALIVDGSSLDCVTGTGATAATDCDDTNPAVYVGATEVCDAANLDEDCDALADDDDSSVSLASKTAYHVDVDADGYGGADAGDWCDPPAGYLVDASDCDDADAAINPGATEICDAADTDEDCDGAADDLDASAVGTTSFYADADADGYGSTSTTSACDQPAAFASVNTDCDDTDASVHPGAVDITGDGVDADCDTAERCYLDADADGYRPDASSTVASIDSDCADVGEAGSGAPTTDCDDASASVHPGAAELPGDEIDEDCDGVESCYVDADEDGARSAFLVASPDNACVAPGEATAAADLDCDDGDAARYPAAAEVVGSGVDEDCDGAEPCYVDADDDGWRPDATSTVASVDDDCADPGEALASALTGDCDDADPAFNPGESEPSCTDPNDYNCDGTTGYADDDADGYAACEECDDADPARYPGAPEAVGDQIDSDCDDADLCYVDADFDGYRADSVATRVGNIACDGPGEGTLSTPTGDCDDTDGAVNPSAIETVGDGVDADCDGAESCYTDADGDSYRSEDGAVTVSDDADCADVGEAPVGAPTDCDDGSAAIRPSAAEVAGDGVDQDCDDTELCYADVDGDGYRPDDTTLIVSADLSCASTGEASAATPSDDCDDRDPDVHPDATESVGDARDLDCDGGELCYLDADDDGYVDGLGNTQASADADCDDVGEASATVPSGDCDDTDPSYNPGVAESDCTDSHDYNCDGSVGYADVDEDGWAACRECNDGDPAVNPDAIEVAGDTIDGDCDGTELCYVDNDDDGFRPDSVSVDVSANVACDAPTEAVAVDPAGDCDDGDETVHPGAIELAGDEVDQDCDGLELCYVDADGDGYTVNGGESVVSEDVLCSSEGEASANDPAGDCDDASPSRHPGASEADCTDPVDYNCDGSSGMIDGDADGWAACEECDDADEGVNPDVVEVCSGVDEDCDGTIDVGAADARTWYADADGDGFTNPDARLVACDPPDGYAEATEPDCDDTDPARHPGAQDPADDGIDQDCDGADPGHPPPGQPSEDPPTCGCASTDGAPAWALVVLGAIVARRRRAA
jgi:MYXO-CTERM domain-containing protein